jgi:type IV pilus assembly protein PilV
MIEILISLVIIAIAMLGAAGIQLNVLRLNKGSQSRTQAIFLASDMAERIEANKAAAVAGNYSLALTSASSVATTNCMAQACDSPTLASWDLSAWGQSISTLLPQASWSITPDAAPANPITYTILIRWVDRSDVDSVATGTIVNSYTSTRTLSN